MAKELRALRASDELWQAAHTKAKQATTTTTFTVTVHPGDTVSDVLRRSLERYVEEPRARRRPS